MKSMFDFKYGVELWHYCMWVSDYGFQFNHICHYYEYKYRQAGGS